jgi:hypothetical protein
VSLDGHEFSFDGPPPKEELVEYVQNNYVALSRPRTFLGGWYDSEHGKYVLDVSITVEGEAQAAEFARKHHLRAVYRPQTGETVTVAELTEALQTAVV